MATQNLIRGAISARDVGEETCHEETCHEETCHEETCHEETWHRSSGGGQLRQPRPGRGSSDQERGCPCGEAELLRQLLELAQSSASDCPLTYAGITLYGTLDIDAADLHQGVGSNPSADKVSYGIQKNSYESKALFSINGISASAVGLKMKEGLPYGWSLIGVLEAGVNPYSGMFYNGPGHAHGQ